MGRNPQGLAQRMIQRISARMAGYRVPYASTLSQQSGVPAYVDLVESNLSASADSGVSRLFDEIETTALAIYASHGLPTVKGEYTKSPRAKRWRYLSQRLTAEERWALVLASSATGGVRFGSLEDLGEAAADGSPLLKMASSLLSNCRALQVIPEAGGARLSGELLERAIRLGVTWNTLQAANAAAPERNPRPVRSDGAASAQRSRKSRKTKGASS